MRLKLQFLAASHVIVTIIYTYYLSVENFEVKLFTILSKTQPIYQITEHNIANSLLRDIIQRHSLLSKYHKILRRTQKHNLVYTRKKRTAFCLYSTRVGALIVATIYLQLIQNRYMFRSFTVLQCSHQHCVQPVASDVEVVRYL